MATNFSKYGVYVMALLLVSILFYAFAKVDKNYPWHPLQQIAINKNSDTSIDDNGDGRIDQYRTEETLQSITENGAVTNIALIFKNSVTFTDLTSSKSITINKNEISGNRLEIKDGAEVASGLTTDSLEVTGTSTFTRQATFNSDVILNSIKNCNGDLQTDANGKIICGTDEVNDADHSTTNEIIDSVSLSLNPSTKVLTLNIKEYKGTTTQTKTASVSLASIIPTYSTPTLAEVLNAGNDAQGKSIVGLSSLTFTNGGRLEPTTVNGVRGIKITGSAAGLATSNIKAAIYELGGKGYLGVEGATLSKKYISGYGDVLEVGGTAKAIKSGNAYLGDYLGKGTVAVQQICLNGDCKTSWSQVGGGRGGGGTLQCMWKSCYASAVDNPGDPGGCTVHCPSGYTLTGHAFSMEDRSSKTNWLMLIPTSDGNGMTFKFDDRPGRGYIRCCRIA